MEEKREKSFLDDWKNIIGELKRLGLITNEQINNGIVIPIVLIANEKINRDFLQKIIKRMHETAQSTKKSTHYCLENPILEYYEFDGEPILQIREKKGITYFANIKLPVEKGKTYQMRYFPKSACIALGATAFNLKKEQIMHDEGICEQAAYRKVSETFFETRGEAGQYISEMFTQGAIKFGEFCKQQIDGIGVKRSGLGPKDLKEIITGGKPTPSTVHAAAAGIGEENTQLSTGDGGKSHEQ